MLRKFSAILSDMGLEDLNDNELKTLNFIIDREIHTCCSSVDIICDNCPFYKTYQDRYCLHSFYNNNINRISLCDLSKAMKEYLDGGKKYWED